MLIRVHSSWKDSVTEDPNHNQGRRSFIEKAAQATLLTAILPKAILSSFANEAMAASPLNCSTGNQMAGGLMHIFSEGGPTMGARFLSPVQADAMNANMASRYGINPTSVVPFGGNGWGISSSSAFGQLLVPPPGISAAKWATILGNISLAGVFGPFNQDDGGGDNLGQIAGCAGLKPGVSPSDILLGVNRSRPGWATGLPSVKLALGQVTPGKLGAAFSLPATGTVTTNTSLWAGAVKAMGGLAQAFNEGLGVSGRAGGQAYTNAQLCGASSATVQTDPAYGSRLFDPAQNARITGNADIGAPTLASLTDQEKAILSAAYRSADGTVPGVMIQFGGRDYHGAAANVIGARDYEEAQAIKMWILASALAGAPAALIYNSNGQAIASGTTATTVGAGGAIAVEASNASGDAGGSYNAGFLLLYNPAGSAPRTRSTGTFNTTNGNATSGSGLLSVNNAIGALYYTAFGYLKSVNMTKALTAMRAGGVSASAGDLTLIT